MGLLLEVGALTKVFVSGSFGRQTLIRALDGIDFQIFQGETVGLVGESGSGKTTLARSILRLIEPTSGKVEFEGEDLTKLKSSALRRKRKEMQIIFQNPVTSLDPRMSVEQIMIEPYEAHGLGTVSERREWIRGLFDMVSLDHHLLHSYPEALSGGQQQRVAIARALALHPKLLIADEPVSALDPSVQAQIMNLLAELRRRTSLTMVLISHSLPVVHYLCNRVIVMYLGRIVEDAPADRFFSGPAHPYSRLLFQSMPEIGGPPESARQASERDILFPAASPSVCSFHPRCPQAFDRCKRERPELYQIGENSRAACFLYT